jgi:hypothetical protein
MNRDIVDYATQGILSGMSFDSIVKESISHIGGGCYEHIGVHITESGMAAGWSYRYPSIRFNGIMFKESGKTIEQGIKDGHLALDVRTTTCF